jgi:hypothetical protein
MKEDKDFTHLKATEDFGYNPMAFEEGIKVPSSKAIGL